MVLDRALCYFQPILVGDRAKVAHASLQNIRNAANALILQCAASTESSGGMASNIGMWIPAPILSSKTASEYLFLQAVITTYTSFCPHTIQQTYSVVARLVQSGVLAKISSGICHLSSKASHLRRQEILAQGSNYPASLTHVCFNDI